MPERRIEAGARRGDLDVGGYHGLTTAYRGPHRLAQHRVDAYAACAISPFTPTSAPLPYETAGPSSSLTRSGISLSPKRHPALCDRLGVAAAKRLFLIAQPIGAAEMLRIRSTRRLWKECLGSNHQFPRRDDNVAWSSAIWVGRPT